MHQPGARRLCGISYGLVEVVERQNAMVDRTAGGSPPKYDASEDGAISQRARDALVAQRDRFMSGGEASRLQVDSPRICEHGLIECSCGRSHV